MAGKKNVKNISEIDKDILSAIKELSEDEFSQIVVEREFNKELLIKDYYITILLYLLKDIEGLFFKGGTALQKTFLNYARLSEDIDFTIGRELKHVKKEIINVIDKSRLFGSVTKDKEVTKFTRLVVPYNTILGKGEIFIDLNERAKLLTQPKRFDMKHFYPNLPKFKFLCLSQKEMVGEKVAAAIGRNKPRDHFDIYQIIKQNIPIDMKIVKAKCKKAGNDANIIKMFNRANKLFNKWNNDMIPLIKEDIEFKEVMNTLADYFNLKDEKEKLK